MAYIVVVEVVVCILEMLNVPDVQYRAFPIEEDTGLVKTIFALVIVTPFFETLLNQSLPYWLLSKIRYFRKNPIWIIFISALVFGLFHFFSTYHIIVATLAGAFFMYAYILRVGKNPIWTVVAIHALANAVTILRNYL